ncbi:DUF6221 family protein [Streptomyces mirabilis]|uniref:DUF6221 family protein n=1 Tax=Streptomyces mirabilis TaxID=68239 RepID=UPI0036C1D53F
MTDTDRMVVWLRETMDAAEADAEAATPGPWSVRPQPDTGENWEIATTGREQRWVIGAEGGGGVYDKPDADHIARHDPAAVLRRIDRDRKILAEHADNGYGECKTCSIPDGTVEVNGIEYEMLAHAPSPCTTVRNLAEGWGWTEEAETN